MTPIGILNALLAVLSVLFTLLYLVMESAHMYFIDFAFLVISGVIIHKSNTDDIRCTAGLLLYLLVYCKICFLQDLFPKI